MKAAAIGVVLVVLAVYGLNRGIFIGSTKTSFGEPVELVTMSCRYLFVTGITEVPARGGQIEEYPQTQRRGIAPASQPDSLYCRFFAD